MFFSISLLLTLLAFSALFSAIEIAMFSLSKTKVRSLVDEQKNGATSLLALKSNPHRLLITVLVINNLINIFIAAFSTAIAIGIFGNEGIGIATGVVTFLILVFGEIVPKSLAIQNAEKISLLTARPIQWLQWGILPIVLIFEAFTFLANKLAGEKKVGFSEAEIRSVIRLGKEEGILDNEASERLHSVLDFETITVKQIMTPKAQVISFEANISVGEFLQNILDAPFDHYPLYEGDQEKIIGVLDVIDVLRIIREGKLQTKLKDIMRPTFFVAEDTRVDVVLTQARFKQSTLGIVINHENKIEGVFTSQDIVEEIVGDIFETAVYKSRF